MERFLWNDTQNCNSNEDAGDQESYADIYQWDDILEFPISHPQHQDQIIPQDIQRQQEIHNVQSTQSCGFSQQSTWPSTMHVSTQNQMSPQCIQKHLQHENLQSMQPSPFCPQGLLPPTKGQVSFQNQECLHSNSVYSISQQSQHLANQATLSVSKDVSFGPVQLTPLSPLGQTPPTEGQASCQNQQRLNSNSMYGISQYPQHLTEQATLSAAKDVSLTEAFVEMLPTSSVTQQQYHQHIQQQLAPQALSRTFPQSLAQSLINKNIPDLSMINQEQKLSSQMSVIREHSDPNLVQANKEEWLKYACMFNKRRTSLGFSQDDVVCELFQMYEENVHQSQLSRFENLQLHLNPMRNLKLLLDRWLANIEATLRIYRSPNTKERDLFCRTNVLTSTTARQVLEKAFLYNPNPAMEEIGKLAKSLTVDNESVSTWFYNRRDVLNWIQSLTICNMESDLERMKDEENLKNFAKTFKLRRTELYVSRADASIAISKLQGESISERALRSFENGEMSFRSMRKLKPVLQQWLKIMEDSPNRNMPFFPPVTSPEVSVSYQ